MKKRKKVGNYLLERTLGGGSFGKVRLASHIFAKEKVAVKVITKKAISLRDYLRKNLRREALMLQKLCHPNIIHLYEVMETENGYYMVLELAAGGEFVKYLSERKRLSEVETRKFMRQLVSAVDHIHQSGIVHRDIKVDNLLLDGQMNVKVIDFGLGNFCEGDQTLTTQCGSPAFTAPEVFSKRKYGPPVDIWSLGVNMFVMLTGRIPFETTQPYNLTRLYAAMLRGCSVPDTLSSGCQELIQRMLDPRDTTRITVGEIVTNPWLTEGYTEPVQRVGAVQGCGRRTVSEDVVEYISRIMKTPEKELRRAIQNRKPNSFAAMHDLLVGRLEKGLGFPGDGGRSTDVESPGSGNEGHGGHESNGMGIPEPRKPSPVHEDINHVVALASQDYNNTSFTNTFQQNQTVSGIGCAILNGGDRK
ncbi:hormonally up-regulated neu tumor-associated kinase-like [Liolophura sinensis]|uniref:hormonally up-regulated neu tumor-associated kinase-like n=1 Tax=Liolophura sinensis TaxID=3198878 RepID=UPI0031593ADD